jgi:cytochrome c peroxidase
MSAPSAFTPALRGDSETVLQTTADRTSRIGVLAGEDVREGIPLLSARGADSILVTTSWVAPDLNEWISLCDKLSREYNVTLIVSTYDMIRDAYRGVRPSPQARPSKVRSEASLTLADIPAKAPQLQVRAPLGLPTVPFPTNYEPTDGIVQIGRKLFFDTGMSRNGAVSCATCHEPGNAYSNGLPKGIGLNGQRTARSVPSLLNVAYRGPLLWDGFIAVLENQVKYPINHAVEMNSHYLDDVLTYVRSDPDYSARFRAIGAERVEFEHVARALATFQRTLLSGDSLFDHYFYGGDTDALGESAKRGFELFRGKANCTACHSIHEDYALFTDNRFHNTGVGYDFATGSFSDLGLGHLTHSDKSGLFLTPSLRDVALTAPYMHDGSLATIEDVIAFYNGGATKNPRLDPQLKPLFLTETESTELAEFLRALTGKRHPSEGSKQ